MNQNDIDCIIKVQLANGLELYFKQYFGSAVKPIFFGSPNDAYVFKDVEIANMVARNIMADHLELTLGDNGELVPVVNAIVCAVITRTITEVSVDHIISNFNQQSYNVRVNNGEEAL